VCLTREQMLHFVLHTLSTMNAFNPPVSSQQHLSQFNKRLFRPYLYHDPMSSTVAAIEGDLHSPAQLNVACEMHCSRLHCIAEAGRRVAEANPEALATAARSLLLPRSLLARPDRRKGRLGSSHRGLCAGDAILRRFK
jgi:hypothetical protein